MPEKKFFRRRAKVNHGATTWKAAILSGVGIRGIRWMNGLLFNIISQIKLLFK
jgi:hypothetical protein